MDLTDERTVDGIVTAGVLLKGAPVPGYPGRFEPDQTRYIGSFRVRYSQDGINWIWVYNKSGRVKVFPGHSEVSLRSQAAPINRKAPHMVNWLMTVVS